MSGAISLEAALSALRPLVDRHVTRERVRRYLSALVDTPAPSTAAGAMRVPVLKRLLADGRRLRRRAPSSRSGFRRRRQPGHLRPAVPSVEKPFWYFAHLDTISYLVQPAQGGRTPLVPFACISCATANAPRTPTAMTSNRTAIVVVAEGRLESVDWRRPSFDRRGATSSFCPAIASRRSRPFATSEQGGLFTGLMDNAGGVAALAVAAPVLAEAGVEALLAFPDEEEGPVGAGNQTMCRGSSSHRGPSAAAEARDCRRRPAGRRRSGRGHAGRRRELDAARRGRRAG